MINSPVFRPFGILNNDMKLAPQPENTNTKGPISMTKDIVDICRTLSAKTLNFGFDVKFSTPVTLTFIQSNITAMPFQQVR